MAATLDGTSAVSILTAGVSLGGIGQSALASNRFVEAGMVLGHGVPSYLKCCDIGCGFRLLPLLGCIAAESGRIFFQLGPIYGVGNFLKFPLCQIIYSYWNGCGC